MNLFFVLLIQMKKFFCFFTLQKYKFKWKAIRILKKEYTKERFEIGSNFEYFYFFAKIKAIKLNK